MGPVIMRFIVVCNFTLFERRLCGSVRWPHGAAVLALARLPHRGVSHGHRSSSDGSQAVLALARLPHRGVSHGHRSSSDGSQSVLALARLPHRGVSHGHRSSSDGSQSVLFFRSESDRCVKPHGATQRAHCEQQSLRGVLVSINGCSLEESEVADGVSLGIPVAKVIQLLP
jgi:hypothetical protein